jgi:hypothetical protein
MRLACIYMHGFGLANTAALFRIDLGYNGGRYNVEDEP